MIITIINFALFALPLILGCRREGVISIDFVLFTPRHQRLEDNGEGGGCHLAVCRVTGLSMLRNSLRKVDPARQ